MFELYKEDIRRLKNRDHFNLWLETIDDCIELENIDNLIEVLIEMELPDFVMAALDFKKKYL